MEDITWNGGRGRTGKNRREGDERTRKKEGRGGKRRRGGMEYITRKGGRGRTGKKEWNI